MELLFPVWTCVLTHPASKYKEGFQPPRAALERSPSRLLE